MRLTIDFEPEEGVLHFHWDGGWRDYEALGILELAKQDALARMNEGGGFNAGKED